MACRKTRWGIAWLFIVLAITSTIYRTSIRRLRQRVRDQLVRQAGLAKLSKEAETLEWLNSFLIKFWAIYEPALCEMVVSQVNPILASSTPSMIESLFRYLHSWLKASEIRIC